MADQGIKLLTGTVRRWDSGSLVAIGRVLLPCTGRCQDAPPNNRAEEAHLLGHLYDSGDQPDAECLVIIADDPAELRRVREMLEGVGDGPKKLWSDHAAWSQATFGSDRDRGPQGPLAHLKREAIEASAADGDHFPEEIADCLLLVLDAARRSGMSWLQLWAAAAAKLQKNKGRVWGAQDHEGVCEHVENADD